MWGTKHNVKIIILSTSIVIFNVHAGKNPDANLTVLKKSLTELKSKLTELAKKLNALNYTLKKTVGPTQPQKVAPIHPKPVALIQPEAQGSNGIWMSLDYKPNNLSLGVKIFKKDTDLDFRIETLIFEHICLNYKFITDKVNENSWKDAPFTKFFYSNNYKINTMNPGKKNEATILQEIRNKLENLDPDKKKLIPDFKDVKFITMENFATKRHFFQKKVRSDGWNAKIEEFANSLFKLPEFSKIKDKKNVYIQSLKIKIGKILLLFYFMGVTFEDCDIFIIFNNSQNEKLKNIKLALKKTVIKLVDFGECFLFYDYGPDQLINIDRRYYNTKNGTPALQAINLKIAMFKVFDSSYDFGSYKNIIETEGLNGSFKFLTEFKTDKYVVTLLAKFFNDIVKDNDIFKNLAYNPIINKFFEKHIETKKPVKKRVLGKSE